MTCTEDQQTVVLLKAVEVRFSLNYPLLSEECVAGRMLCQLGKCWYWGTEGFPLSMQISEDLTEQCYGLILIIQEL